MKNIILLFGFLAASSGFCSVDCIVNNAVGQHFEFSSDSNSIQTGAPYGLVKVVELKRSLQGVIVGSKVYELQLSDENQKMKVVRFKKYLSVIEDSREPKGNLVCN
jgi:hypothetical protein